MARRLGFICTTDRSFKAAIGLELMARLSVFRSEPAPFLRSLSVFIEQEAYAAFRVDWCEDSGEQERYSGGLVTLYLNPFAGYTILCVEAAWFADVHVEAHEFVWTKLVDEARRLGCNGLAVRERTVEPASPLLNALESGALGKLGVVRERHLLLQHWSDGWWSAFTGITSMQAKFVDCLRVLPPVEISIAGVAYDGSGPLYRGEGRVGRGPYAMCRNLPEVVERVFEEGFRARAEGMFSGTLIDQIRQQGYISSPTLSLTASYDTAVLYATARGTEEERDRGVVFSIAPDSLRRHGPVWDSLSSMESGTHVWVGGESEAIVELVKSNSDLHAAGEFLERISQALTRRASEFHASPVPQPPIRLYMKDEDWRFGERAIGADRFEGLCSALEYLVPFQVASPADHVVSRGRYALAFSRAFPELKRALEGSSGLHRHPGWDATLFGYIAKTCRDREMFSSGSIPPDAVTEAVVVSRDGVVIERISRKGKGDAGAGARGGD